MSFYSEFSGYYEQVFPFREEVYVFLERYAGRPECAAVLDVGCGPGHYCGRFSHAGIRTEGIDLDGRMIEAARASYPEASFHCMDMTALGSLAGPFSLVYCIGNVLAHLTPEKLERFIDTVYSVLAPGGSWFFQLVNWDAILGQQEYLFPVRKIGNGELAFYRRYHGISPERVVFEFSLRQGDSTIFSERFPLYPVTSDRLLRLHQQAGFCSSERYGGFDGAEFCPQRSGALVMVFRKDR